MLDPVLTVLSFEVVHDVDEFDEQCHGACKGPTSSPPERLLLAHKLT